MIRKLLNKCKDLPVGVKASLGFFIANMITYGIAYITSPIYTRLLSAAVYGKTSSFLACFSLVGVVAMFSLSSGVYNNGMVEYPEKRDEYAFSLLVLSNIITAIVSVVLFVGYPLYKKFIGLDLPLVLLMCLLFLFQPAYNFWASRQRFELKYRKTLFWSLVCAVVSPASAIICILLFESNALYARIFGAEIVLLFVYVGFYIYLAIKARFKVNKTYWKEAFRFNLPLIPHYLSQYMLGAADKLMISYFVSDEATAYYSVANSVAVIASVVWSAINASLLPFTYEKCKEKDFKAINRVTLPIMSFFSMICIGVVLFAPEVVLVMGTEEYLEAIYVMPPVIAGVFFQAQYYVYSNIVYYHKKPTYVMVGSVLAMLFNIVLNFYFIKRVGYIAAGYTTLFCYVLQAVIDYFAMRKVVGKEIYNMKFMIALSGGVIVISLLSNLIYDFWIVRYSILAVACIVLIIMRKKVIGILGIMKKKTEETTD